jgi:hypothetical protein
MVTYTIEPLRYERHGIDYGEWRLLENDVVIGVFYARRYAEPIVKALNRACDTGAERASDGKDQKPRT